MQPALHLFGDVCGESYAFDPEWRRILDRLGNGSKPLFCALARGHDGRHVDKVTGIPWDAWEGSNVETNT